MMTPIRDDLHSLRRSIDNAIDGRKKELNSALEEYYRNLITLTIESLDTLTTDVQFKLANGEITTQEAASQIEFIQRSILGNVLTEFAGEVLEVSKLIPDYRMPILTSGR